MKTSIALLAFTACTLIGSTRALSSDGRPALVPKAPERIFTPHGFDSNDNVQVVVDDVLSSTCYKAGPITHVVDKDSKTIRVTNHHFYYDGCWCADVITPYFQPVNLGPLDAGAYSVVVEDEDGKVLKKGMMRVNQASTLAPDDYLYAPVATVHVEKPKRGGNPVLTIAGEFTNSCMKLKEIRPTYSPENVIEVLPIVEMEDKECASVLVPFKASIELTAVPKGRTLIHVRSLNGQAVNQVYTF